MTKQPDYTIKLRPELTQEERDGIPNVQLQALYYDYPGDEAWSRYANNFPEIDDSITQQIPLDADMARAIYYHMGGMKWVREYLEYNVPRLDGYTPAEVYAMPYGQRILRTAIMRIK